MSTMDLIKSETLAPTLAFRFRMLARKKKLTFPYSRVQMKSLFENRVTT